MKHGLLKLFLFAGIVVLSFSCTNTNGSYDITELGAKNNPQIENTLAIQKAVDQCALDGGGTVIVPSGQFNTETIFIKSKVNLHIEEGGELLGSINLNDYSRENRGALEAPAFDECLLYAEDATDVGISGKGTINKRYIHL